ncbi:MAG TPA: LysM peptidoglycan-binding domain-containing protein [Aggregatilineaceae bacterium]|nr:LysM peptidoglycan-binding domain-containing protein [Aggregatilineaceae bacterium]
MRARYSLATLLFLILLGIGHPVFSQGGGTNNNPPGGTTIHVVQSGETLFQIAIDYGTTVEAIATVNGITDEAYISVGQRLLIPNAQATPGALVTVVVNPGDTLRTLARTYNTTIADIANTNHITNAALLYVGEELAISQGAADPTLPSPGNLYYVEAGDTLYRLALRYHLSLYQIMRANDLSIPVIVPGQILWIPSGENSSRLYDLPYPYVSCDISPIPAVQGETMEVHFKTRGPVTVSGIFMDYPLQIMTQDMTDHYALIGIHAFTASGIYPLMLNVTQADGSQVPLILYIRIDDGGYSSEEIDLATEQQNLLANDVNEPEWIKIATIMSGFTAQRYFDGLMGLPSSGAITSQFGTRRSYNGDLLSTFHSGTDFGAGPGSPIAAPAPGTVVLVENLPVRGNATIIDHGWGVYTGYWHQSEVYVAVGDVVSAGQVIGAAGSTGRSTGPHLHWEMWVSGVQVNPMQWVQQSFP